MHEDGGGASPRCQLPSHLVVGGLRSGDAGRSAHPLGLHGTTRGACGELVDGRCAGPGGGAACGG